MNLNKEHAVLAAAVVAVVAMVATMNTDSGRRATTRSGKALELQLPAAPELSRALPETRELGALDRNLFSPPSDTRPLTPLELQPPPYPQLSALRPPPEPGPRTRLFGKYLRADATPKPASDLFASESPIDEAGAVEDTNGALKELKAAAKVDTRLSPDEIAAQVESWKRLYDWIRISEGRPLFGYIRNEDRFGLRQAAGAPILFVEVDPSNGKERFPGQAPVKYERPRVLEFALANTFENEIQLRRREFGKTITAGQYQAVLGFADECVRRRTEARRALEVAEEMYKLAATQASNDPAPQLGLARCYEAEFQFEKAYAVYQTLLAGEFAHHPEVHARMAEIEARLRLFESAEKRFAEAERLGRADWSVQWSYGRFLFDLGRSDEALEHLRAAYKAEPGNELKEARTGIRIDLGRALVAVGNLAEARELFAKALQSDPTSSRARAGLVACDLIEKKPLSDKGAGPGGRLSFEELYDRSLADLAAGDAKTAVAGLELAAQSDPLRAGIAWRALSWIAETTGHPEEAFRFAEMAAVADPTDPWTLYQRGRLLAARDDFEGAHDAFQGALDQELDFVDALVGMAELYHESGDHASAERYFARALELDDARAEVHALRGWNQLEARDLQAAQDAFQKALKIQATEPTARLGLAWCSLRRGDADESKQLFAEVIDGRRGMPETDPFIVYGNQQLARITEHDNKAIWSDKFERRHFLMQWQIEEAAGPTVTLADGHAQIEGKFNTNGTTRGFREWPPADFYSVEMDLLVDPSTKALVGMFVSKERPQRTGGAQTMAKVGVALHPDGQLQVLTQNSADAEEKWVDVPTVGGVPWWPTGKTVHVRIERIGEGSDATGRISVDGITVAEGFKMSVLAGTNQSVRVGAFAEGATGRPVKMQIDNVEVVQKVTK